MALQAIIITAKVTNSICLFENLSPCDRHQIITADQTVKMFIFMYKLIIINFGY